MNLIFLNNLIYINKFYQNKEIQRKLNLSIFSLLMCSISFVQAQPIYTIESFDPVGRLTVSLTLPIRSEGDLTKLSIRNRTVASEQQIENIRCDTKTVLQKIDHSLLVPKTCQKVIWDVTPRQFSDKAIDLADQLTFKPQKSAWILFSESTSILYLDNEKTEVGEIRAANGISLLGATPSTNGWKLPPENSAPEFFVIGNADVKKENIGDFLIQYVSDNPKQTELMSLQEQHKKVFHYLSQILPVPKSLPENERSMLVIWIGIDEKHGQVSGAAGRRSFIANYVFGGNKKTSKENNAYSLLVMAHEQFHQIADMFRVTGIRQATWIEESLAQYYALKALQTTLPKQYSQQLYDEFVNTSKTIDLGLVELDNKFKQGHHEYYSRFYTQGATFWAEIDSALQQSSQGKYNLDMLLPELLNAESTTGGQLPLSFREKLLKIGGNQVNSLFDKYL